MPESGRSVSPFAALRPSPKRNRRIKAEFEFVRRSFALPAPQSLFPAENSREKVLFLGFGDETKTKHVSTEFNLVLDELQNFPLAGTQRDAVQDKGVLNILGSKNKPSPIQ